MAADLAEMPVDEFLSLNPQHNRPVIAGADETTLLLPYDKAELFAAKLELSDQPMVTWQAYKTNRARRSRRSRPASACRWRRLRTVNGIGARANTVPAGHALLVPSQAPSDATAATLQNVVFTDRAERAYRLPSRRQGRDAGVDCGPLRRHAAGPAIVERRPDHQGRRGPEAAHRQRRGADPAARPSRKKPAPSSAGRAPKATTKTCPARTGGDTTSLIDSRKQNRRHFRVACFEVRRRLPTDDSLAEA